MGGDDVARHMTARDRAQVAPATDAADFIRRAAEENRRIDRRNDVILGAILLVGGAGVGLLAWQVTLQGGGRIGFWGASIGAISVGASRLLRGLRG